MTVTVEVSAASCPLYDHSNELAALVGGGDMRAERNGNGAGASSAGRIAGRRSTSPALATTAAYALTAVTKNAITRATLPGAASRCDVRELIYGDVS